MGYGRLGSTEPGGPIPPSAKSDLSTSSTLPASSSKSKKRKLVLLSVIAVVLVAVSAASAAILVADRKNGGERSSGLRHRQPSQAISKACSKTRYPTLCVDSLLDFPGSTAANEPDLVHISFNVTLQKLNRALYTSSEFSNLAMPSRARSAYDDCLELLDDSITALTRSLLSVTTQSGSTADVLTWLSAALTNQDTCLEGFDDVSGGGVKEQMMASLKDLSELVSNCLAIFSASNGDDFSGVPIQNKRRLMHSHDDDISAGEIENGLFPKWVGRRDRMLLQMPVSKIQADIVVAQDGSGTFKTIGEAIKKAPEQSGRRTVIYIKRGRYEEDLLKVGKKKTNLMFIGDGKGLTVITGGKSVGGNDITTFRTASFAASGDGFIARDMTFQNTAGPGNHQAVALRLGADHGVIYHCSIIGYQDTLYVHSQRQFFRECDIYGTVDFIFGNAAVVFQKCNMYARKPMSGQKVTITAQNRKDPNQNTGISIHNCQLVATADLEASKGSFPTYLGRPWKLYSRTVYMLSFMGDHIHPRGWLEWNGGFALDTLYYGEYLNSGPGSALAQRVKWPGYRVITSVTEASKFTVGQFIYGSSWLPSTGVAFVAGLQE